MDSKKNQRGGTGPVSATAEPRDGLSHPLLRHNPTALKPPALILPGRTTEQLAPLIALLLFLSYIATGMLGLNLPLHEPPTSLMWAPAGIALGAHIRYGPRAWLVILPASFLVLFHLDWNIMLSGTLATLGGPLLGAVAWRKWARSHSMKQTDLRDIVYFVLLVAGVMLLSAILATVLLMVTHHLNQDGLSEFWITWWISTTTGALVFTPLILYARREAIRHTLYGHWPEATVVVLLTLTAAGILALTPASVTKELPPFLFLLFPLMLWPALRFGVFESAAILAIISLLASVGASLQLGPFGHIESSLSLEYLWVFIGGSTLAVLTVALLTEATRFGRTQIEGARDLLNTVFDHIGEGALVLNARGAIMLKNQRLLDVWSIAPQELTDRMHSPNAVANLLINRLQTPEAYRTGSGSLLPLRRNGVLTNELVLTLKDRRVIRQSIRYCCHEADAPQNMLLLFEDISREADEIEQLKRNSRLSEFSAHFAGAIARTDFDHFTDTLDHCLGLLGTYLASQTVILLEAHDDLCRPLHVWHTDPSQAAAQQRQAEKLCDFIQEHPRIVAALQRGRRWQGRPDDPARTQVQLRPLVGDRGQLMAILALPGKVAESVVTSAILTLASENLAGMILRQHTYHDLEQARGELERKNQKLKALSKRLRALAGTDQLTGLANRHTLDQELHRLLEQARRYGTSFSVILLDIDFFKQINDRHGHQIGDQVLVWVGRNLRKRARELDLVCRWGGEEFLLLCPLTDLEESLALAERIRLSIAEQAFPEVGPVTISLGVSEYRAGDEAQDLVLRADQALYCAKHQGRNRVITQESASEQVRRSS